MASSPSDNGSTGRVRIGKSVADPRYPRRTLPSSARNVDSDPGSPPEDLISASFWMHAAGRRAARQRPYNMVASVELRMRDRDMRIELTQAAKNLLAERGFDPVLGARPLRRTIQREIEDVLAEKMLFGEVGAGQIVLVDVEGEGPTASFTFVGQKMGELPDLPPFETAEIVASGDVAPIEGPDDSESGTDLPREI